MPTVKAPPVSVKMVRYRPTQQLTTMRTGAVAPGKPALPMPKVSMAFTGDIVRYETHMRLGEPTTHFEENRLSELQPVGQFLLVVDNAPPGATMQLLVRNRDPAKQFDSAFNVKVPERFKGGRVSLLLSARNVKELGLNNRVPFRVRFRDAAGNVGLPAEARVNETTSLPSRATTNMLGHFINVGKVDLPSDNLALFPSIYEMAPSIRASRMAFDPNKGTLTPGRAFPPGSKLTILNEANGATTSKVVDFDGTTNRHGRINLVRTVGYRPGHPLSLSVAPPWQTESVAVGSLVPEGARR